MGNPAAHATLSPVSPEVASGVERAALEVTPLSAFADNYVWLVHAPHDRRRVAVVDPGDARPVLAALDRECLELDAILVTHHHADHVGGVAELLARRDVPVVGPAREDIPGRTTAVRGGDTVRLESLGLAFEVLDVPGHTAGHVAFYGHGALFCGDTLFSAGCGRLFEGTPAQMLASLDGLQSLPPQTRVYCAHEYTAANLRFAQALEPANERVARHAAEVARLHAAGLPTLPSTLALEREINPFLRTRVPAVRAAALARAGRPLAGDAEVFAAVRAWKNEFR